MDNFENVNGTIENVENASALPIKTGFWSKFKAFWLTPVVVELTPHQQKIEDDINNFLHQEITFKSIHDFLFQEVKF